MTNDEAKKVTVTIRLHDELVARLKELAEEETRSFSGQCEYMLRQAVRALPEPHRKKKS